MSIFEVALESFIVMNHELVLLAKQIGLEAVESEFAEYYCAYNGWSSVPLRKLKNIYNLSGEGFVARCLENPYMQYFTGEKVFQKRPPMNPIDMSKFWKRIGTIGAEKIFKISLMADVKEMKMVMIDSMVQEKDITFPTDVKSYRKIIAKVLNMARKKFLKRAGIEPVISHLKSDRRMIRSLLKGIRGDAINMLMTAAAYNLRHWMNKNALSSFISWLKTLFGRFENVISGNDNKKCLPMLDSRGDCIEWGLAGLTKY